MTFPVLSEPALNCASCASAHRFEAMPTESWRRRSALSGPSGRLEDIAPASGAEMSMQAVPASRTRDTGSSTRSPAGCARESLGIGGPPACSSCARPGRSTGAAPKNRPESAPAALAISDRWSAQNIRWQRAGKTGTRRLTARHYGARLPSPKRSLPVRALPAAREPIMTLSAMAIFRSAFERRPS